MKVVNKISPLLQKDYGDDNDCTLTSITTIICYMRNDYKNVDFYYNNVEYIAKSNNMYDESGVDNPFDIKKIFDKVLDFVDINYPTKALYTKVCCPLKTIKAQIDKNNPVILNVWKAGKYKNHTVLIVGYDEDTLLIYDNWSLTVQRLPYKEIGLICSINYVVK